MAKLGTEGMTLEITYPYERADAVIVDFRVQWHGRDVVSTEVLQTWDDAPRPEEAVFSAWQYEDDRLIRYMRESVEETVPTYWDPTDPTMSITFMPDCWGLYTLHRMLNDEKELPWVVGHLQCMRDDPKNDDKFAVNIDFSGSSELDYKPNAPETQGHFGFTIFTTRAQLRTFADQLQQEHETCRKERKMDSTDEDTLWRMLF